MPSSAGPYGQRSDPSSSSLIARHPKRRGVALSCAECRRYASIYAVTSRSFLPCTLIQVKAQVNIPLSLYSMFILYRSSDVVATFLAGKHFKSLLLVRPANRPCSNCVKKGCAAICPDGDLSFLSVTPNSQAHCLLGSLTTGKGNRFFPSLPCKVILSYDQCCRFVLANTEALHEKINLLANRVRHLEDGLAEAHSLNSHHPHPLLRDDLLQIKRPLERERLDVPPTEEKPDIGDSIDSLGSL